MGNRLEKSRVHNSGDTKRRALVKVVFPLTAASVAFVVRSVFCFFLVPEMLGQPSTHTFGADGYGAIAHNLIAGAGYRISPNGPLVFERTPLYPGLLAGLYGVFGETVLAVQLTQALLGAATAVLVWWIGRRLFGTAVGIISASAFALYPLAIWYASAVFSETLFTFLLTGFVAMVLWWFDVRGCRLAAASGAVLGLAMLTRPVALLLPFVIGVAILVRRRSAPGLLSEFALFLLAVGLAIAPWTVRNYVASGGRFIPIATGGGGTIAYGTQYALDPLPAKIGRKPARELRARQNPEGNPPMFDPAEDEALYERAIRAILAKPGRFLKATLVRAGRFWYFAYTPQRIAFCLILHLPILLFAAFGIANAIKSRVRGCGILIVIVAYFWGLHSVSHAIVRYSVPIMPLVIVFASYGLVRFNDVLVRASERRRRPREGQASGTVQAEGSTPR